MAIYLLKSPLTEDHLDRWYNAMTHSELAGEEGKSGDSERYSDEASSIIEEWHVTALADTISVTVRSAPISWHISLKLMSVTPAMGDSAV